MRLFLTLSFIIIDFYATVAQKSLFSSISQDSAVEVFITLDWKGLEKNKSEKIYQDARIGFVRFPGDTINMELKVRTRGNMRLKICDHPPIKLKSGRKVAFLDQSLTLVRERERDSISKNMAHDPFSGIRLREEIWNYLVSHKMDNGERYEAFRSYVFKNLRAVFIQQKEYAISIHEKYFQRPIFTPRLRSIPLYGAIYKLLGFRKTEELMAFYRKIRSKYFRGLPVNR